MKGKRCFCFVQNYTGLARIVKAFAVKTFPEANIPELHDFFIDLQKA
jgi:hypothetical protein